MASDFVEKNARRARVHASDPALYRHGRANRQAWARGGAFGRAPIHIYIHCVLGTTGAAMADPDPDPADELSDIGTSVVPA
jgi:hypothetical protein